MQVPVDDDLPEVACDFVQARGARFNEGRRWLKKVVKIVGQRMEKPSIVFWIYIYIYIIEWASARVPPTPPIWGVLQREGER